MRLEKKWTMERKDRLKDPEILREWQELKNGCHEAIGDTITNSFKSMLHLAIAIPSAMVPRVNTEAKNFSSIIQFDPLGRLSENVGKSAGHLLQACGSLGLLTGRAGALALRRIAAL